MGLQRLLACSRDMLPMWEGRSAPGTGWLGPEIWAQPWDSLVSFDTTGATSGSNEKFSLCVCVCLSLYPLSLHFSLCLPAPLLHHPTRPPPCSVSLSPYIMLLFQNPKPPEKYCCTRYSLGLAVWWETEKGYREQERRTAYKKKNLAPECHLKQQIAG